MLVCNVSLRPKRSAISADLTETVLAADLLGIGNIVFAALVDDPASVTETVDAFLGDIMLEPASAADAVDSGLLYATTIVEALTTTELPDATITPASSATTWNPSDKSANITLTSGNLTVSNSTGPDGGVRSTTSKTTGKVYFEYTTTNLSGGNTGFGLATSSANLAVIGSVGAGGLMIFASGAIYFNGSGSGLNIGSPGNNVAFAIDVPNKLFWARGQSGAGNWNGSGTANPATGAGGLDISALFSTNAVFACVAENSTAANISANFGATSFIQSMPSGFTAWT